MADSTLEEIPIRLLYEIARSQQFRVCITIDGPTGRSFLDTLDVWDGRPGRVGSRLISRASIVGRTVDDAAKDVIEEIL